MKVGKEEIVGLIVALERFIALDHQALIEGCVTAKRSSWRGVSAASSNRSFAPRPARVLGASMKGRIAWWGSPSGLPGVTTSASFVSIR